MSTFTTAPSRQRKPLRIATDISISARHSSDSSSGSSSSTGRGITPSRITPSTGNPLFHVECLYDFESSDPVHLSFRKDEVLTIVKQEASGWWAAMRHQGDHVGWIPSSFVLPLDRSKVVEYPTDSSNDVPVSAVHEWVPVSEDYRVPFHLVTPTDFLCKGFENRVRIHESALSPPYGNRPSDLKVPPSPITPPPYKTQRPQFLHSLPVPASGTLQLAQGVALRPSARLRGVDDRASFACRTPDSSDAMTPELIYSATIAEPSVALTPGPTDRGGHIYQSSGLRQSDRDQVISVAKLRSLTSWDPDSLAEQLCVLMHNLYATIQQNDCLDWIKGRRSTEVTGLRRFLDVHDDIAVWVHGSVMACDRTVQQVEVQDFWIRVAEKCRTLRNFDSLCAVVVTLSRSSPSSLAQCKHKQILATLRSTLDAVNQFRRLIDTMDAAKGPSVPFVRVYLDHIKELANEVLHQSGYVPNGGPTTVWYKMQLAAVATLLRHQSLPYDLEVKKPLRRFIDGELQRLAVGREPGASHG